MSISFFFFFQAEDGIRDYKVTGVQTCALPISGDDTDGDALRGGRIQPGGTSVLRCRPRLSRLVGQPGGRLRAPLPVHVQLAARVPRDGWLPPQPIVRGIDDAARKLTWRARPPELTCEGR